MDELEQDINGINQIFKVVMVLNLRSYYFIIEKLIIKLRLYLYTKNFKDLSSIIHDQGYSTGVFLYPMKVGL